MQIFFLLFYLHIFTVENNAFQNGNIITKTYGKQNSRFKTRCSNSLGNLGRLVVIFRLREQPGLVLAVAHKRCRAGFF